MVSNGRSYTTQQAASSTGALVTGLTEKLNQKRIDVSMSDGEVCVREGGGEQGKTRRGEGAGSSLGAWACLWLQWREGEWAMTVEGGRGAHHL
jgi:hypothetical protein